MFCARLLWRGILPGGPTRWYWFARTLVRPPRLWHVIITDWILGLSIRDFVVRTFDEPPQHPVALPKVASSSNPWVAVPSTQG